MESIQALCFVPSGVLSCVLADNIKIVQSILRIYTVMPVLIKVIRRENIVYTTVIYYIP